jgi:hypothetical protein
VVSMTTPWRCHRFKSWLAYGDPSLGVPATLVEEIGLKIVVSSFFLSSSSNSNSDSDSINKKTKAKNIPYSFIYTYLFNYDRTMEAPAHKRENQARYSAEIIVKIVDSQNKVFDSHRDIGDARHRFLPPRGTKFFTFACCRSNKFTNRYRYEFGVCRVLLALYL